MNRQGRHFSQRSAARLHRPLLRWYDRNKRPLPWRTTRSPYRILVSEVMLQQTQVSRVVPKYREFLRRFPTLRALANARRSDVITAWRGMGYNARAVRLHRAAQTIVKEWRERVPADPVILQTLPGMGRYTAHAVAAFAHGRDVPVVDTNISRVIRRLFPRASTSRSDWDLAQDLLPRSRTADWSQALMDLGATVCTAASPRCTACPLRSTCPSAFSRSVRVKAAKREPSRDGIPNRIYRGRIVECLRNNGHRAGVSLASIGRTVKRNFGKSDYPWIRKLIAGLERDGLVATMTKRKSLFVSLAE